MKRTKIRRVSAKRAAQLREYSKLRKQFLIDHPYCQWWMKQEAFDGEGEISEKFIIENNGRVSINSIPSLCPMATDIHHMNGRYGNRLNDVEFWMGVSREGHTWIHNNPKLSRERGYLNDI